MHITPRRLLLALIAFHLAITAVVFTAGRLGVAGSLVNEAGDLSVASDGVVYRKEAVFLAEIFKARGLSTWHAVPFQWHVKIFSLLFLALGPVLGQTILTIEPWNALCYALIAILVFKLGRQIFDQRTAIVAAAIAALWPSLLLHTTQFLKDPPLIVAMLALILISTSWLTRIFTWRLAIGALIAGTALVIFLRHLRREMWLAAFALVITGCALLLVRQIKERKWYVVNTVCALLLLVTTIAVPVLISPYRTPPELTNQRRITPLPENYTGPIIPIMLTRLRNEAAETGSALDANVKFETYGDIVRYLPRAAVIGLLAPFPSMWFSAGQAVGRAGRWLSGIEMLVTYLLVALAIITVWFERRRLSVHALWILILAATTALGLTVANVGTLYRMRYPFWILLALLGARGLLHIVDRSRATAHS
ncbi:MAG TPA: hypothetical protein VJV03_08135 [Pyrinomonadaceae bacterium]|nr:hypothetical protein [Pyrinomonadaceae bacterium]